MEYFANAIKENWTQSAKFRLGEKLYYSTIPFFFTGYIICENALTYIRGKNIANYHVRVRNEKLSGRMTLLMIQNFIITNIIEERINGLE